jgi:hypothetical protein
MNLQYFPPHTFYSEADRDSFVANWYSVHLLTLEELPLWQKLESLEQDIYRFLWLRTFHAPIVIRININPNGKGILITKMSDGRGGYGAGRLIENKSEILSKDKLQRFVDQIEKFGYWDLPSKEKGPDAEGFDGSHWIIEAAKKDAYKIVDRWSPKGGPIRVIGLIMLQDLAKLKLHPKEIY